MRSVQAAYLAAIAIGSLGVLPVHARDRPGTPNQLRVTECQHKVIRNMTAPTVCIAFYNTAKEDVWFEAELTIDGRQLPVHVLKAKAECYPIMQDTEGFAVCVAAASVSGYRGVATRRGWQGIALRHMEYDTEYCLRFRTRAVDTDVVSALWSSWACTTTNAKPRKPARPRITDVRIHPDEWAPDLTTRLGNRVSVLWDVARKNEIAEMSLKVASPVHRIQYAMNTAVPRIDPEGHGTSFVIPEGVLEHGPLDVVFVVCATNVSGETCSTPYSSRPVDPLDVLLHEPAPVTVPPREGPRPDLDVLIHEAPVIFPPG